MSNSQGEPMQKPILIFLLALPLSGQKPSITQRVQAQAVVNVGMANEAMAPAIVPQSEASEALVQTILSADPLAIKRQEGNGIRTGTKIRLPPFKGIVVQAWYLADKVSKELGIAFRF